MKIANLTIDERQIAAGIYDLIEQRGEEAIVAFGMIPMWSVDTLEKLLREKVLALAAGQVCLTGPQLAASGLVDEAKVTAIVRDISKAVCTQIYAVASSRGKMCV